MTLLEIKELKRKIDKHKNILEQKQLEASMISDAFAILISRGASQALINIWLKGVEEDIEAIIKVLDELE